MTNIVVTETISIDAKNMWAYMKPVYIYTPIIAAGLILLFCVVFDLDSRGGVVFTAIVWFLVLLRFVFDIAFDFPVFRSQLPRSITLTHNSLVITCPSYSAEIPIEDVHYRIDRVKNTGDRFLFADRRVVVLTGPIHGIPHEWSCGHSSNLMESWMKAVEEFGVLPSQQQGYLVRTGLRLSLALVLGIAWLLVFDWNRLAGIVVGYTLASVYVYRGIRYDLPMRSKVIIYSGFGVLAGMIAYLLSASALGVILTGIINSSCAFIIDAVFRKETCDNDFSKDSPHQS